MHDSADNNAMTEVALAMAFFSLMVLGMVSMSMPVTHTQVSTPDSIDAVQLRPSSAVAGDPSTKKTNDLLDDFGSAAAQPSGNRNSVDNTSGSAGEQQATLLPHLQIETASTQKDGDCEAAQYDIAELTANEANSFKSTPLRNLCKITVLTTASVKAGQLMAVALDVGIEIPTTFSSQQWQLSLPDKRDRDRHYALLFAPFQEITVPVRQRLLARLNSAEPGQLLRSGEMNRQIQGLGIELQVYRHRFIVF